ncbi:folate-binding protein [Micrococcus sp.]|uniref:CAF17-like 4Fe-4S cluster assembly/insertion protein YgfZ n=1 Tax=Micrococcus sp. TaxID=1271 RepID=UPI002A91EBED|nr:folate-binding protein [Micrococcus sp.]MDY6055622.1 folate-binding protein [Micrococcus sp.]
MSAAAASPARRSPLLAPPLTDPGAPAHGAVEASGPEAGVAAHYGRPVPEQRALGRGRALVDLSSRTVLSVSGPDRLAWLHTLSSQHLADLTPGTSTEALFLDANGRIETAVHLLEDGAAAWLIVDAPHAEALTGWLRSMVFSHDVVLRDHSAAVAVVGAMAPVPGWEDRTVWLDPWPQVAEGGWSYGVAPQEHPGADWSWREYLVTCEDLARTVAGLGQGELTGWSLAGTEAAEALRIAAGRPRPALDADARALPHELDLLRTAVHLAKGCYRGQETVARVHNLGRPPRRLTQLLLDGSTHTLPEAGAAVVVRPDPDTPEARAAARPVGTVTSAARHHEAGPVALALLKRAVPVDAPLLVREQAAQGGQPAPESWIAAAQEPLVLPEAGQVVGRPAGLGRRH